jgi:hypothetical protein
MSFIGARYSRAGTHRHAGTGKQKCQKLAATTLALDSSLASKSIPA